MFKRKAILTAIILFTAFSAGLKAQFIEDALRFSIPNGTITPRVANMGVSYHGLADDIGALIYNPAGIGIIGKSELSIGMGFTRNSTETEYLGAKNLLNTNDEYITHAGLIAPFKTGDNSAAIGIGYFLESNFDNMHDYSGFNTNDTYIGSYVDNTPKFDTLSMMYNLGLAAMDPEGNMLTPLDSLLAQKAEVNETGGIHNLTGSVSWNVNKNFAVGFSITGKWGTYNYERKYTESDPENLYSYNDPDYNDLDFRKFTLRETLNQDISGISGAIGVMGRFEDFMRFGVSIKLPTFYEITEDFSQYASAEYDNDDFFDYEDEGQTSYNVTTPFVYCAGVSFHAQGLTFSAGVEYTDVTQIEFSDATSEVEDLNGKIIRELVGQTTWGFGAEYQLPKMPFVVRASYSSTTSPYSNDISNASISRLALGGGVYVGDNVRIDGVFMWTDNSQLRANYLDEGSTGSDYIFTKSPTNLGFQVTYRY